jgi:hypothetical protein
LNRTYKSEATGVVFPGVPRDDAAARR